MAQGFDDIELIELGFTQINCGGDDYYYALDNKGVRFITNETKEELKRGQFFSLNALADYDGQEIRNCKDVIDIVRIFGKH